MVNVFFAFLATVATLVGAGLLISHARNERLPHLLAWCVSLTGLCITLVAMTVGFMVGFESLSFRIMELGGALIAPVWLVLGVVELICHRVQVRFGAWLFAVSYSIVAAVIILLDPLNEAFDKTLPKPDEHYTFLPMYLLGGAHVIVVIGLVACAAITALRARDQDSEAHDVLLPVALVTLAGVLLVSAATGSFPGFLTILALGGAVALTWYGAMRTLPVAEQEPVDDELAGHVPEHRRQGTGPVPMPERSFMAAPTSAMPTSAMPTDGYVDVSQGGMGSQGGVGLLGAEPPGSRAPSPLYGRITVYTLLEGREEIFDRLAAKAVRAARDLEPDTLMFICHEVVNAPNQRICYQVFRSKSAYQEHQRLPQVQRFLADGRPHVRAMNVVELKLTGAKAIPLPAYAQEHL